jgi:hypothetical protein
MTSGEFHRIPVDKLWVARDERQRRKLDEEHISALADSIRRIGLIHPLVIDRDYRVWAGECRFMALKMLGHDSTVCQFLDELDEATRIAVEFEENVKRRDLTWQEQCNTVAKYHSIRLTQEPGWSREETGKALGLKDRTTRCYFMINEEAKKNPEIMKAPELSTAQGMAARYSEKRSDMEMERALGFKIVDNETKEKGPSIITADFTEWVKTYDGPRFNFLHCDFPYGIETDKRQQGNAVTVLGGYDDTPDTYFRLLGALCDNITRVCTDTAHIMFWFSMRYYHDTLEFFSAHSDFVIDPFPLVWLKSDGVGLLPDPQRGPRRIYETCLFGSRGDRKIVSSVANAFASPTDIKDHVSTKPEPVLCHFFRMFVDENSVVLDPTCGSGSALRAAKSLGAGHVFGIEINAEFADQANRRMRADAI